MVLKFRKKNRFLMINDFLEFKQKLLEMIG